jgi:hypothetical protein
MGEGRFRNPSGRPTDTMNPIISLLIWILYFLVPSEGGIVDGIPAGHLETIGVLLVVWIAAHRVRIAGAWAAAAVTIAAVIAAAAVPGDRGMTARYYATAAAGGAHERSPDYPGAPFTRIDRRIDFLGGVRDVPLGFFNDHTRFNFMQMGDPDRRALEFSAVWTGWLHVPAGSHAFYLHSPDANGQLLIDTLPVLESNPRSPDPAAALDLTEGWHRLHVTFSSPYGGPRSFAAGMVRNEVGHPFDASMVRTERIDDRQQLVARVIAVVKPVADVLALAWIAGLAALLLLRRIGEVWQRRQPAYDAAIALFIAAGALESLRFAWPWAERFRVMTAGDDTITYEGYARDILLNGILMNGGLPPGQGEPFYYQAFYPYFLAFTHAVFGEGFFGALFLQRLMVVLTAVVLTRIAVRLRGPAVWPFALVVSTLFTWWKFAPIAADMLSESLYVPLVVAWAGGMVELCRRPGVARAALIGVVGGLAAITRSTALLAWALVWPALFWHLRGRRARPAVVAALVACSLAVFSLITIRNWIVSHQFAPTSTELGITIYGGNQPPGDLVIDPSSRRWIYDRLGIGGYTVEVIEYAIAAPGPFSANIGRKALFALGFYEPYADGWGYSPVYIACWVSAVAGLVLLLRSGQPPMLVLIPLFIAAAQYVAVVIIYPKGERLIVPIHTLLVPYSAIAAQELWSRVAGRAD